MTGLRSILTSVIFPVRRSPRPVLRLLRPRLRPRPRLLRLLIALLLLHGWITVEPMRDVLFISKDGCPLSLRLRFESSWGMVSTEQRRAIENDMGLGVLWGVSTFLILPFFTRVRGRRTSKLSEKSASNTLTLYWAVMQWRIGAKRGSEPMT